MTENKSWDKFLAYVEAEILAGREKRYKDMHIDFLNSLDPDVLKGQ